MHSTIHYEAFWKTLKWYSHQSFCLPYGGLQVPLSLKEMYRWPVFFCFSFLGLLANWWSCVADLSKVRITRLSLVNNGKQHGRRLRCCITMICRLKVHVGLWSRLWWRVSLSVVWRRSINRGRDSCTSRCCYYHRLRDGTSIWKLSQSSTTKWTKYRFQIMRLKRFFLFFF